MQNFIVILWCYSVDINRKFGCVCDKLDRRRVDYLAGGAVCVLLVDGFTGLSADCLSLILGVTTRRSKKINPSIITVPTNQSSFSFHNMARAGVDHPQDTEAQILS